MTIAFFVILILNCFVIFAADALLGSVENINKTLVIEATTANSALIDSLKSNAALYFTESNKQGADSLEYAEGNSFKVAHNESLKRTIVGRKGVTYPEDTSSPKSEYTSTTLDKVPTSSATIANAIFKNRNTSVEASSVNGKAVDNKSTTSAGVADNNKTVSANSTEHLLKTSTSSTTTTASSSSSSSSSTSTSSTTTSTSKPTTIALKPMKPSISYSVEDNPKLLEVPIQRLPIIAGDKKNLDIAEELPISQPSRELQFDQTTDRQQYVIPIIVLIFAVPMVLGMVTVFTRRFKHYWSTRHYRRMDFLVDGMYNT